MEIEGRIEWSSNFAFLVRFTDGERAVYKPERGEQPLHDFPSGLFRREIAAYRLARRLGWPLVPEAVERKDGPFGSGSLQRFVDADFSQHYLTLPEQPNYRQDARGIVTFDLLCNNADRKSGHVLLGADDRLYAIDNALTFHVEPKLRTVMWDFAGEEMPAQLLEDIAGLIDDVPSDLEELLAAEEIEAMRKRARMLLASPMFPQASGDHPYPWPLV
jgi:uncharacterized repeat protein (TIGR03843 family)